MNKRRRLNPRWEAATTSMQVSVADAVARRYRRGAAPVPARLCDCIGIPSSRLVPRPERHLAVLSHVSFVRHFFLRSSKSSNNKISSRTMLMISNMSSHGPPFRLSSVFAQGAGPRR